MVTGFDGGFAGDGVKKLVAERLGVEGAPLQELAGQLGEGGFGIRGVHVAGHAAQEDGAVTEVLDAEAAALKERGVFQCGRGFLARQSGRDGRKERLGHDRRGLLAELFKQNALVRGMLVDENEVFVLLDEEIGVQRFADHAPWLLLDGKRLLNGRFGRGVFLGSVFRRRLRLRALARKRRLRARSGHAGQELRLERVRKNVHGTRGTHGSGRLCPLGRRLRGGLRI